MRIYSLKSGTSLAEIESTATVPPWRQGKQRLPGYRHAWDPLTRTLTCISPWRSLGHWRTGLTGGKTYGRPLTA